MKQLFNVCLLVRNEYGQYTGGCEALYITYPRTIDILAHFIAQDDDQPFCSFHAGVDGICLGDQGFQIDGYRTHVGTVLWDLVKLDYQGMTKLWALFIDRFWESVSLQEADSMLYDRWERKEYVNFTFYDYQSAFYRQMYWLCGEREV